MEATNNGLPPYDQETIRQAPFAERLRLICLTWLFGHNGTPMPVYFLYLFKIVVLFIGGWMFCCSFTPGMGWPPDFFEWVFEPIAFQKLVLWALFFESIGMGCSFGPMVGRFIPPIGGFLYFLRPGTIKLPLFPGLPLIGGSTRNWLDVLLYAANTLFLVRALIAPELTVALLMPPAILIPLLGITDKTVFLAARAEHYWVALVCLAFAAEGTLWISGAKLVWLAIWFWAATSKLNQHFPSVIAVMLTNSPLIPAWFHKKLYTDFPHDLRPSRLAAFMAHWGTFVEYTFPFVLLASDGGPVTTVALVVMLGFHSFIGGNFPMGMPVEWNVAMVLGGLFLFGGNPTVSVFDLTTMPLLLGFLVFFLFAIPLYGNFVPSRVSFLMAMRYYAGNWAYSVWLFRGNSQDKLDQLPRWNSSMRSQLGRLIQDEDELGGALMMTPSFRLMHIQGRALHDALPRAVDNLNDYEWVDGELIAGQVIGWNFGDGHLHHLQLLKSIQEKCQFEPGELRVVMVESQPMAGDSMAWVIADAADGVLETGESKIAEMTQRQPWPTGACAEAFNRQG